MNWFQLFPLQIYFRPTFRTDLVLAQPMILSELMVTGGARSNVRRGRTVGGSLARNASEQTPWRLAVSTNLQLGYGVES